MNTYPLKRVLDVTVALIATVVTGPLVALAAVLIFLQDGRAPLYCPWRIGQHGRRFRFYKLRTMCVDADATQVDSTSASDPRITPVGKWLRAWKLDELPQCWNVLLGDMSVVGPRPNVERETRLYTAEERRMLEAKPGITDLASIVFSDLAELIEGASDPNLAYNQLVRPWKSRLALLYCEHASFGLDLKIIGLTLLAMVARSLAVSAVGRLVRNLGAPEEVWRVAQRLDPLVPAPPPGATEPVRGREVAA